MRNSCKKGVFFYPYAERGMATPGQVASIADILKVLVAGDFSPALITPSFYCLTCRFMWISCNLFLNGFQPGRFYIVVHLFVLILASKMECLVHLTFPPPNPTVLNIYLVFYWWLYQIHTGAKIYFLNWIFSLKQLIMLFCNV